MRTLMAVFTAVALFAGFTGCVPDSDTETMNDGKIEIAFAIATDKETVTRTGESAAEQGTAFRVVVYNANENPATATPVATGVYTVIDDSGNALPQTVDDRIFLYAENYDFYFIVPTGGLSAGIVTAENGDRIFTTGKQTVKLEKPVAGNSQYTIPVVFKRRNAMLDIVVYYKNNDQMMTSLTVPEDKTLSVSGLFSSAKVPLDGTAVTSAGNTGTGTIGSDKLASVTEPAGTGTTGFSTFTDGTHRGLHVLPGTMDLSVVVPVTINGSIGRNMQAQMANVKFDEGKYYTLKLQVSLTAPVVATIEEWVPTIGNGDEGMGEFVNYINQPSNCYITRPGVLIRFDATKKPRTATGGTCSNPSTVETDNALSNDLQKEDISSVKIVWQTAINHSSPASGKTADMILQHVSYNAGTGVCTVIPHATGYGNALIAAYAADGTTILWNWHIWVTDGEVQANVNTGNMSLNGGGKFMDRNLGALAAITTQPTQEEAYKYFGLLYQHGRPTPFTGQGIGTTVSIYTKIYRGDGTEITPGSIGGYTFTEAAVNTVTAAIEAPMVYYSYDFTTGWSWLSTDISLWSDYGKNSKSIYDPCPYGYRVPQSGNSTASSWYGFSSNNIGANKIENGTLWSGSGDKSWWPIAGYRYFDTGSVVSVGGHGDYWSSTTFSAHHSYRLFFDYKGTIAPSNNDHRSCAFSVRCVEDKQNN